MSIHIRQMYRDVSHIQIQVDDNAPAFAKAHIKQENVWHRQIPGGVTCSLTDYPAHGQEIDAWKTGIHRARELARDLGMVPINTDLADDDDDDDDDDLGWFFFGLLTTVIIISCSKTYQEINIVRIILTHIIMTMILIIQMVTLKLQVSNQYNQKMYPTKVMISDIMVEVSTFIIKILSFLFSLNV